MERKAPMSPKTLDGNTLRADNQLTTKFLSPEEQAEASSSGFPVWSIHRPFCSRISNPAIRGTRSPFAKRLNSAKVIFPCVLDPCHTHEFPLFALCCLAGLRRLGQPRHGGVEVRWQICLQIGVCLADGVGQLATLRSQLKSGLFLDIGKVQIRVHCRMVSGIAVFPVKQAVQFYCFIPQCL